MTNEFKQRFKQTYQNDSHWKKILDLIRFLDVSCIRTINDRKSIVITSSKIFTTSTNLSKRSKSIIIVIVNNETTSSKFDLRFKFWQNLIYFVIDDERERLCVLISLKQKMFQLVHDQTHHDNFYRIYDKIISSIYIRQLSQRFRTYINHCFDCQFNQIKRYFIYEKLTSIIISNISFYIVIINQIITFSIVRIDFNILLTIICKFTKRILFIVDKNTWNISK